MKLKRFLPLLLLLAALPDSQKHLETMNNMLMTTQESVRSVKNGMDNFHAAMTPFMMRQNAKESGE